MDRTGEEISESSLCRALKRQGLVIKKGSIRVRSV
jgi:hypothetical protein